MLKSSEFGKASQLGRCRLVKIPRVKIAREIFNVYSLA